MPFIGTVITPLEFDKSIRSLSKAGLTVKLPTKPPTSDIFAETLMVALLDDWII